MVSGKVNIISLIRTIRPVSKYLLAIWAVTIVTLSSIPSLPTLKLHAGEFSLRLDYLIHFLEYGGLALLAFITFSGRNITLSARKFFAVTISVMLFAVIDEYHQKLIPGRSFNPFDIISNLTGILAALIFCVIVFRKNQNVNKEIS